jgi:hypothetical protein
MRRGLLVLATAVALVVVSSGLAGGGTSIANAPELPLGVNVVSGTSNIEAAHVCGTAGEATEFYRVTLGAGDDLVFNFGRTSPDEVVGVAILRPSVTDDTLDQANCVLSQWAENGTERGAFKAPYAGRWIVAIRAATTLSYGLEADILKYTHATLTGPKVVTRGSLVVLRGWIHGVMNSNPGASVRRATMQLLAGPSGYKTLGGVLLGPTGKFIYFWRPHRVGVATLRVVYYFGGSRYLPSRATHSVRVIGK